MHIDLSRPVPPEELNGRFLVATPLLEDPNSRRTVLLIIEHVEEEGTLAVILNRPTRVPVAQVLPDWGRRAATPQVVFTGGAVAPNSALCIAMAPSGAARGGRSAAVAGELVLLDLDEPSGTERFTHIRVLAGYGGWSQGTVRAEIAQGAWNLVTADHSEMLTMNPYLMWDAAIAQVDAS